MQVRAPCNLGSPERCLAHGDSVETVMEQQSQAGSRLRIVVNGEPTLTEARTLAQLIIEAGYADARVATAVNGDFVPERARSEWQLAEGDRVEIVSPRQGG